jgi:hypothetical protein
VRSRLRRLPIAVAVGVLWALLDPSGRGVAGVLGGVAVLVVPEVQPWLVARLRRPGEVPALLMHPGGRWLPGTVKRLDDGVRWRAVDDGTEPREVRLTADQFTFGGYRRDAAVAGNEVLQLHTVGGGQLDLAVPPDRAQALAAAFRIARAE